ncbi:acyl carrier protein [Mangrovibacterium diazotrophicum]|uniref:Acyl carrier protein n=1 Tax=Mangrovibacterium diazotrophicum TaxID=1261403 RepID=A0A419WA24_9BACT|nr:acyl carrier protein [Mangrovibacterium diazotrophicum]RKD92330.1 acyl carrier protein [Mangrovibacterium diazotrophicum]
MENKTARRTLYKVLRKTGVSRNDIELEASFQEDLKFDQLDWTLFLFYLEESINASIEDDQASELYQVKDSLKLLEKIA